MWCLIVSIPDLCPFSTFKYILRQRLSEPEFYGDLVYRLKKIIGSNNCSAHLIKRISHYKKIGYNINLLQQTECLVLKPITVGNFAFLFNLFAGGSDCQAQRGLPVGFLLLKYSD